MTTIKIPLSKRGKHSGKYEAIVDDIDSDLAKLNWNVLIDTYTQYAKRKTCTNKKYSNMQLHRLILSRKLERELLPFPHEFVDHINGNGLDNRRENLRLASKSQNAQNRKKRKNSKSKYKGICWNERQQKWTVTVNVDGVRKHIGAFKTEDEAYEAYCKAADEHYQDFANLKGYHDGITE